MYNQYNTVREYKYEGDVFYQKCCSCGKRGTIDDFPKDKSKTFGIRRECKMCRKTTNRLAHRKWYQKNRDVCNEDCRRYHQENKDILNKNRKDRGYNHTMKIGFDRDAFHGRTKKYIIKHKLRPCVCPICGGDEQIVAHHPSYEKYEDRSKVVFCCKSCHAHIHNGIIECPIPIDLLDLGKSENC